MEYGQAVSQITKSISRDPREVDRHGRSRDDYRQELHLRAMAVERRFSPEKPPRLYVMKSLWNAAAQIERDRWRLDCRYVDLMDVPEETYQEDARLQAREALRVLIERLGGPDATLFARLVEADGQASEVYDAEQDGAREAFRQRLCRLRQRMRSLVGGIR